jgi:hypothetical protein
VITEGQFEVERLACKEVQIGDAVVLMAADGYGKAKVEGHDGKRTIIIRTADVIKNFKFDTEPDPEQLYEVAKGLFEEISKERYMRHGKKS